MSGEGKEKRVRIRFNEDELTVLVSAVSALKEALSEGNPKPHPSFQTVQNLDAKLYKYLRKLWGLPKEDL